MIINRDNYEEYFLDFSEGRLSPELESEMKDFLRANPDLARLLDDFDPAPVPLDENITFHHKQKLKKNIRPTLNIHSGNYEEWMVSSVEGILDEGGQQELREFIQLNPALQADHRLFLATRLTADHTVVCPEREKLKKQAPVIISRRAAWVTASVAALILLMLTLRVLVPLDNRDSIPAEETAGLPEKTTLPAFDGGASQVLAVSLPDLALPLPETQHKPKEELMATVRTASFRISDTHVPADLPQENVTLPDLASRQTGHGIYFSPPEKDRPLVARFFAGLINKTRQDIRDNYPIDGIRDRDVNFWSLASAGIEGFNTLADRDLELYVERDNNGKIESYTLVEQDRLIMTRDMNRE